MPLLATRWRWLLLPMVGLLSLFWYLLRVIPKPSRADYPCQRMAAPLATNFLLSLIGFAASVHAIHRARRLWGKSRPLLAVLLVLTGLAGVMVVFVEVPGAQADFWQPQDAANAPVGTARGLHPGRVVWVHEPSATSWSGVDSFWWEDGNTDQAVVDAMMSKAIRWLAGEPTEAEAWEALFRHFNETHGRGNVGYQTGEKIVIKLNLNNSGQTWQNAQNVAPQIVRALLHQLVHSAGITNQNDITIGDPSRTIGQPIWDLCHPAFPGVNYEDSAGSNGSLMAQHDTKAASTVHCSDPGVWGSGFRYPSRSQVEASYVINVALLRGHSIGGITACAKNWFGSTWVNYNTNGFHRGWTPGGPDIMNGMHGYMTAVDVNGGGNWVFQQRPMGSYNPLVDLMGHKHLGGKTLLYLVDGLYASLSQSQPNPFKWEKAPFNHDWTSSLFASQDPVAIDSVCLDFLRSEPAYSGTVTGTVDNYLHEAAQASNPPSGVQYDPEHDGSRLDDLGVHEHWNNATAKLYTRNLGTGDGIELVCARASLSIVESADGRFSLAVRGAPGERYVTEVSTNLLDWIPLDTNTSPFTVLDPEMRRAPRRVFRAQHAP